MPYDENDFHLICFNNSANKTHAHQFNFNKYFTFLSLKRGVLAKAMGGGSYLAEITKVMIADKLLCGISHQLQRNEQIKTQLSL